MDVLMAVVVVAFAALCALAVRQGRRFHHSASTWLAVSFASLAVAGAMATQLDVAQTPGQGLAALLGTAAGLVLHPIALMQFAHTLQPTSRIARLLLAVVSGSLFMAAAAIGAADPSAFDDEGGALTPAAAGVLVAISVTWLGVALLVGARLIRLGRRLTSSVGRARAWTMAGGVLTLAPAVALPFLLSQLTQTGAVTGALVACGLIYLGYLPPRWLRWTWARQDTLRLAAAELETLREGSDDLRPWLHTVMEVWDGHAAWLEVDGRVVASTGRAPADLAVRATRHPVDDEVRVERLEQGTWHLIADVSGAHLTVATTLDPILFGDDASDLLMATAARLLSTEARRSLEEEARRQQAELHLAETSRLRDDVLSTLSHELRTPLVTIRGIPELMLRRWDALTSDEARHLLDRLHTNALALHRLVETTLLLAQVRAGEARPHRRDVSPRSVVEEGLERLTRVGADLARVSVEPSDEATVHTDATLAGAALAELVHNALVYSNAPSPIHVSADVHDGRMHFRVADRGRGIEETDAGAFLQAFDRAGELLTRDRRGLGLGLTLASDLSLLLQADLDARPREGGGTVVTMALPLARPRRTFARPSRPTGIPGGEQE